MIDFDKLFEEYFTTWYANSAEEFETEDEIENALPDIYAKWCDTALEELNGKSPNAYFDEISDSKLLIAMLIECFEKNINPCILLTDKIERTSACVDGLKNIISGDYEEGLKVTAVNLLNAIGQCPQVDILCKWALCDGVSESLREISVETLCSYPDDAAPIIYNCLDSISIESKLRAAEILCCAKKNEKTYILLTELLAMRHNVPLCAGFIGKYGDERAASVLYPMLEGCNYFEYIEIKNAIERLGGSVDDDRDFSDDPYYKIIKGTK